MKNIKKIMPLMAFVLAVGLAFANKANVQSAGWIELNGVATQLQNDPCNTGSNTCRVFFTNDPGMIYDVFKTSKLKVKKSSSNPAPHPIN